MAGVIIATLILVIILLIFFREPDYCGFWVAPQDFLEEAGLDSMMLFIGKDGGYIFASRDGGEVMMNDPIDVKMGRSTITFKGIEYDFFPSSQSVKKSPGKMILHKGDTVYAVLYHNAELSDLKK